MFQHDDEKIQIIQEGKTPDSMHGTQSKNVSILQREKNHIFIMIMNKDTNFFKEEDPEP